MNDIYDDRNELAMKVEQLEADNKSLRIAVNHWKNDINTPQVAKIKQDAIREILEEHRLIMDDILIFRFERWIDNLKDK